ncbi:MAG: PAS domain S-box protein [Magnetococcales bacterium]|nr:PAS domain S-box protein [Magnetococcales bacterium]MBF0150241.1 PAS domain S-box protein [Magnetococcales bacterium]MBF0630024.1 PAS domain S-box protein [Magnetococcales bacterium]
MMKKKKIGTKFMLMVGMATLLTLLGLLYFYIRHQEKNILEHNRRAQMQMINTAIQGLKTVMLSGSARNAEMYANSLKKVPEIIEFRILRPNGTEAFHDNLTIDAVNWRKGKELFPYKSQERTVAILESNDPDLLKVRARRKTTVYDHVDDQGRRLLTFLAPILFDLPCQNCHGNEKQVLGLIQLTTSLDGALKSITTTGKYAAELSFFAFIIMMALIHYGMRQHLEFPLEDICRTMERVRDGDLNQRILVQDSMELESVGATFNHMLSRLQANYLLMRKNETRLCTIMDNVNEAIITTDMNGIILTANRAVGDIFHHDSESLIGQNIDILIPVDIRDHHHKKIASYLAFHQNHVQGRIEQHLRGEVFVNREILGARKDDSLVSLELSITHVRMGEEVQFIATARDITQRKEAEEKLKRYSEQLETMVNERTKQLVHAERLATLGTFSAGMAHEINNPNSFIAGNIYFLKQFWQETQPVLEHTLARESHPRITAFMDEVDKTLDEIMVGSQRISKIVDSLKTYSKGGMETDRVQCRMSDPVKDAEILLSHRLKKGYRLQCDIPDDLVIYCDRQQMSQVFINLINNAIDALESSRHADKHIWIQCRLQERHYWIAVMDNGPGIPPSLIDKIFDPFFTTKGKTKGTGLGLAIVDGIIKDHFGQITAHSPATSAPMATEFLIILPTAELYHEHLEKKKSTAGNKKGIHMREKQI